MALAFSQFQLIMNDKFATMTDLGPLKSREGTFLTVDSIDYYIEEVKEIVGKYFWVYVRFGASSPRSDDVYNRAKETIESNPRSIEQSELKEQLFVVYDPYRFTLYISNAKKKGFIQRAIKQEVGSDVDIKNIYLDVDGFIEITKTIQKVELIRKDSLVNAVDETFSAPVDCFGLGQPTETTISAVFERKITEHFKKFLREFKDNKSALKYSGLVCIGKDDNNFEFTFNVDTFQQKINITTQKDSNGLYNADNVREEIASRLQDR